MVLTYISHGWYSVLIMERMLTYNLPLKQKPLPVVLNTHLPLGIGDKQMQLEQELECHRFFSLLFFVYFFVVSFPILSDYV